MAMRTRDTVGLGTMPANRLFKVGPHTINAGVDDTGIESSLQNLRRYADDGTEAALYPKAVGSYMAQKALTEGAGLGVYSDEASAPQDMHMELNDGEIAYVLRKDAKNDRWAVHFRGRNSQASLPVRASLGSVLADETLPAWITDDAEKKKLRLALAMRRIHPVGLVNTPGSTADMGGNTTVHVMGPISIKATYRSIEAGQLVVADALDEVEYKNTTLDARAREGMRPLLVPRGVDWVNHDLQYITAARMGCQAAYDHLVKVLAGQSKLDMANAAVAQVLAAVNHDRNAETNFVGALAAVRTPGDDPIRCQLYFDQVIAEARSTLTDVIALACFDTIASMVEMNTLLGGGFTNNGELRDEITNLLFSLYAFADPRRINAATFAEGAPHRVALAMAWQRLIHGVRSSLIEHDDKIIGRAWMPIPQGMTGEILAQF